MNLLHVALTCSSEDKADRFYMNLLGCGKSEPKILPSSLSRAIFNIDSDLTIVNYRNESVHFEVFLHPHHRSNDRRIDHVCLEVKDLQGFLEQCRRMKVRFVQVPKGESMITFASDDDGNLFEIKQALK